MPFVKHDSDTTESDDEWGKKPVKKKAKFTKSASRKQDSGNDSKHKPDSDLEEGT